MVLKNPGIKIFVRKFIKDIVHMICIQNFNIDYNTIIYGQLDGKHYNKS